MADTNLPAIEEKICVIVEEIFAEKDISKAEFLGEKGLGLSKAQLSGITLAPDDVLSDIDTKKLDAAVYLAERALGRAEEMVLVNSKAIPDIAKSANREAVTADAYEMQDARTDLRALGVPESAISAIEDAAFVKGTRLETQAQQRAQAQLKQREKAAHGHNSAPAEVPQGHPEEEHSLLPVVPIPLATPQKHKTGHERT